MYAPTSLKIHNIDDYLANISIVGERRIGKSSLAFRVFHEIKEKDDTLAIYLDCDSLPKSCDSDNEF